MRNFAARAGQRAIRYRIVVRGGLPEPLVGPLQGMAVEAAGDESVLTGYLVDQSQLQGALNSLSDLGVEIVSVNPTDEVR